MAAILPEKVRLRERRKERKKRREGGREGRLTRVQHSIERERGGGEREGGGQQM